MQMLAVSSEMWSVGKNVSCSFAPMLMWLLGTSGEQGSVVAGLAAGSVFIQPSYSRTR